MKHAACSALILVGAACLSTGCQAQQRRPEFDSARTPAGFMLQGVINSGAADLLKAELRPHDNLIVTSGGGERAAAAQISALLDERDVDVVVGGDCYSACALYLALGAPSTRVPEGATLLFHNDTATWLTAVERRPELFDERARAELLAADAELRAMLSRKGIDPAILTCISNATDPKFEEAQQVSAQDPRTTAAVHVVIPTKFDWAWLSPEVMAHFGVEHIAFEWVLDPEARTSFSGFRGTVAWIDHPDECL